MKKIDDEFSIPTDISDLLLVCQTYSSLDQKTRQTVEMILEIGIDEAIKHNIVKQDNCASLKNFFKAINNNPYFGEASEQAQDVLYSLDKINSNFLKSLN